MVDGDVHQPFLLLLKDAASTGYGGDVFQDPGALRAERRCLDRRHPIEHASLAICDQESDRRVAHVGRDNEQIALSRGEAGFEHWQQLLRTLQRMVRHEDSRINHARGGDFVGP